jgi:hypothetical protein
MRLTRLALLPEGGAVSPGPLVPPLLLIAVRLRVKQTSETTHYAYHIIRRGLIRLGS